MSNNFYGMSYALLTFKADLGVFVNLLLYDKCLYIECISLWHILCKLIELCLKAAVLSEEFSTTIRN